MSIKERLKYVFIFLQILLQNHIKVNKTFAQKYEACPGHVA